MQKRFVLAAAVLSIVAGAAWAVDDGRLALSEKSNTASAAKPEPAADKNIAGKNAADKNKRPGARIAASGKGKSQLPMTPEREAAAMTFVTLHHADLAELLKHLKQSNPREYQRALRELFRQSENLAQTQEKDARRYEFDLEAWKLKSRIQLIAARLSMSYSKALEDELRTALSEQVDLRVRQQEMMRERLTAKLQEIETEIAHLNQDREGRVDRELRRIMDEVRPVANTTIGAK